MILKSDHLLYIQFQWAVNYTWRWRLDLNERSFNVKVIQICLTKLCREFRCSTRNVNKDKNTEMMRTIANKMVQYVDKIFIFSRKFLSSHTHTHTHTELLFWPMWYKIINLLVELHTVMYVLVQFCVYLRVSSSLADFTSWKIYPSLQQIRFRLKIILRARWQVISISKSDTPSSLVSACQKQSSFNFTGEILATAGGDSAHIINGNELARLIYSWGIKTSRSLEDLRIISRATLFLACFSTNVNGQRHSMYLDSYRGTRINNGITFSTLHRTHV